MTGFITALGTPIACLRDWGPLLRVFLATAAVQGEPSERGFWFGEFERQIGDLIDPTDVEVADDGTIWILEGGRGTVSQWTREGVILRRWGEVGFEPGQMLSPRSFAIDGEVVFVADTGNHRIQVFDLGGVLLRMWGARGHEPGHFLNPAGIAVQGDSVIVTDSGNDRVQVFDRTGNLKVSFGERGTEPGKFRRPLDVAIDQSGNIYFADADNSRIQKFDSSGTFLAIWGEFGPFIGLFDEPRSIDIVDGEVIVTDRRNHRVQFFTLDGEFKAAWGIHEIEWHEGNGKIHYPSAFAIAPSGEFAVVCETREDRCQIFTAADPSQERKLVLPNTNKTNQTHFGDYLDIDRNLMVLADPENFYNLIFDIRDEVPVNISRYGDRGDEPGLYLGVAGFDLDFARRRIAQVDPIRRRVQEYAIEYDPDGPLRNLPHMSRFARSFGFDVLETNAGRAGFQPAVVESITRGPEGERYFVDTRNARIIVFDDQLQFQKSFGAYGDGPGQFRNPTSISFSKNGERIFVVDSPGARIVVFATDGDHLSTWGTRGDEPGSFLEPFGMTSGRDGFVYVTDRLRHRVLKFTEDGSFVAEWGSKGYDMGQLWKPKGIKQADDLRLFIIDQGNHRAQIFSPDGEWLVTFGIGRAYTRSRPFRRN